MSSPSLAEGIEVPGCVLATIGSADARARPSPALVLHLRAREQAEYAHVEE